MPLLVIVGATGTGKSALALDLAEALAGLGTPAEIVNADAMQLYRGMDIGTAKVPESERRGIPHHLLDVLDPLEEASVAAYQRDARAAIERIRADGAVPILVGGSGLYVSSVVHDYAFPGRDPQVRTRLETEYAENGIAGLHARLALADPAAATAIGPHNERRIIRALEVVELEGSFTPGMPEDRPPWCPTAVIVLGIERARLVPRLDARVETMWELGLLQEVRGLCEHGLGITASRAIGYAQALGQLAGERSEPSAIAATQSLTRRYARRQVAWFRRYREAPGFALARLDAESAGLLRDALAFALGARVGED